jgi:hypothetical protein
MNVAFPSDGVFFARTREALSKIRHELQIGKVLLPASVSTVAEILLSQGAG